jgi:hypothetical protein
MNLIYPPQSTEGFLTRAETGQFATTGALDATGAYLTNLIASISGGGGSDPAFVTGASGVLQSQINTINSAGYLSSGQADLKFIHLTGNETVSGTKIFRAVQIKTFAGDGIVLNVDGISGSYLVNTGAGASINLLDSQLKDVVNTPKLDWQNNTLTGVWHVQSVNNLPTSIINFASLTSASGALAALINSSAAGVSTLNSLSGALNILGTGNVTVTTNGQNIIISGAGSSVTVDLSGYITTGQADLRYYPISSNPNAYITTGEAQNLFLTTGEGDIRYVLTGQTGGFATTGFVFNNYYLITNPSGYITGGDLTRASGSIISFITGQSGFNSLNYANISNLAITGSNLHRLITGLSGDSNAKFYLASNPQQYATSGDVSSLSGALISQISAASAGVASINGTSGVLNIVGTGSVSVTTNGQTIIVSGISETGVSNVNLSGYITTGQADLRYYSIQNPNGFLTTGEAQNLFLTTGEAATIYYPLSTNPSGYVTSGDLASTSGVLVTLITGLSGDSNGKFYPAYNPQQYVTSGNLSNYFELTGSQRIYSNNELVITENSVINVTGTSFFIDNFGSPSYLELYPHSLRAHSIGWSDTAIIETDYSSRSISCYTGIDFDEQVETLFVDLVSGLISKNEIVKIDLQKNSLSGDWITNTSPSNPQHIINLDYLSGVSGVIVSQIISGIGLTPADLYSNPFVVFKTGNQSITGSKSFVNNVSGLGFNTNTVYNSSNGFILNTRDGMVTNPIGLQVLDFSNRLLIENWSAASVPTVGDHMVNLGYLSGVSGVLRTLVAASAAGVSTLNTLSGNLNIVGTGSVSVTNNGQNIIISGTSSSAAGTKTYSKFTALDNQPPSGNYATFDTRNTIAVLDFDDTVQEEAIFVDIMPEAASLGSGLIVRIIWAATTATTGNCRWGAQFMRLDSGTDIDADSFDTAVETTTAAPGTSGQTTTTSITITTIDSIIAGDAFRLKVYRDVTDGADTMVGDAEVIVVEIRSAS